MVNSAKDEGLSIIIFHKQTNKHKYKQTNNKKCLHTPDFHYSFWESWKQLAKLNHWLNENQGWK